MTEYQLLSPGKYRAHATATAFRVTDNGNEELTIFFSIPRGEEEPPVNVSKRLYFTEKAREYSIEALRAAGFVGNDIISLLDLSDASALLPAEVQVTIEHEDYNNKTYNSVSFINRIGGGPRPLSEQSPISAKAAFAAKMRGPLAGAAAPAVVAKAAPREKVKPLAMQTSGQHRTRPAPEPTAPDECGEYPPENEGAEPAFLACLT